jgi:hypothetical protein
MRWVEHVPRMGERTGSYGVLVGMQEGKRQPERPDRRRDDNIGKDINRLKPSGNFTYHQV